MLYEQIWRKGIQHGSGINVTVISAGQHLFELKITITHTNLKFIRENGPEIIKLWCK